MADEQHGSTATIRSIDWREVFPFTHLFRAFRIAVHPSKLILALVALLMIYFGGMILDVCWPKAHLVQPADRMYVSPNFEDAGNPRGIFRTFFHHEVTQVNRVVGGAIGGDFGNVLLGIHGFLVDVPGWLLKTHPVYFTLFTIWFLLVWSVFGGAIARIAAVHVARDEKISVRQALRFSSSKILSFLFAPLIPLLIVLFIAAVVALGGLLFYIPVIGPILAGLVFILALVAGVVAALVLVGTVGGFNLMYPTIAVEGSDSFDAISRSFSYVFARPWRMAFYTLVAIVYGAITYTFVRFFIYLALYLTHAFVGWWLGGQAGAYWHGTNPQHLQIWPTPDFINLTYEIDNDRLKTSEDISAGFIAMWVYLLIGLLGAFAISFYFSANTIIYFLMRREVDATDLDDVYAEDADDEFAAADAAVTSPASVSPSATIVTPASDAGTGGPPSSGAPDAPPASGNL